MTVIANYEFGHISVELATHQLKRLNKIIDQIKLYERRN